MLPLVLIIIIIFYGRMAIPMAVNPLRTEMKVKIGEVAERIGHYRQRQVEFVVTEMVSFLVKTRHFENGAVD